MSAAAATERAEEIRRHADDIISRPGFDVKPPSFYDRAREWVIEQLTEFLERFVGEGGLSLLGWVILAVACFLVLLFIVLAVSRLRRDPSRHLISTADVGRPSRQWIEEAQRHELNSEWREALRCRYRALLAELAARNLIEEIPGRTAGEYRLDVNRALPGGAEAFARATDLFELAWYGKLDTGEAENSEFRRYAEATLANRAERDGNPDLLARAGP